MRTVLSYRFFTSSMLAAAVVTATVRGDDRLLFQTSAAEPYVMTLLDVSGSMAWQVHSPAFEDGGIVPARGSADDPNSRLYLAKSALYDVVRRLHPEVRLGFAHFNQRDFKVLRKHWLYRRGPTVTDQDLPWFDRLPFPALGDPIQFGEPLVDGGDFDYKSCDNPDDSGTPAHRIGRLNLFPKLGHSGTRRTRLYTRHPDSMGRNRRYEVTFSGLEPGELGKATMDVEVRVRRVDRRCVTQGGDDWTRTLRFVPLYSEDNQGVPLAGGFDYLSLHQSGPGSPGRPTVHNFELGDIMDASDYQGCPAGGDEGWDRNHDPVPHDLTYPDAVDPSRRGCRGCFDRGDVLPWDWMDYPRRPGVPGFELSNRDELLRRLAPNTFVPGEFQLDAQDRPIPDFRIARYFDHEPDGSGRLPLKEAFARTPPIAVSAFARTPLKEMMDSFGEWYDDWEAVASEPEVGDPSFRCREKYVILLTDGVQTCNNADPAQGAAALFDRGIRVFAIGLGAVATEQLQAIADEGGTGELDKDHDQKKDCAELGVCPGPVLAHNRQELIEALDRVMGALEPRATSIAKPLVPQVQAETQDSIILTRFTPLEGRSVWPGSVFHFARPLPLTVGEEGRFLPDTDLDCSGLEPQVGCLAWDAGKRLLEQSPTPTEVELGLLRLGPGVNQRRVYYAQDDPIAVPKPRRLFAPPRSGFDQQDLWRGLEIDFVASDPASEAAAEAAANEVIDRTLAQKTGLDSTDPYILGDIFHSDPVILGAPGRHSYFVANLYDNGKACDDPSHPNPGYPCFFAKHRRRRKVVFVGSNDGQLHAFDGGRFKDPVVIDGKLEGELGVGSGHELFSYIPRGVLPAVRKLALFPQQRFTVDGTVVIDDVFMDPEHLGLPREQQREWRTVLVGGLREGGRGYYALDVTQPDHLVTPARQAPPAEQVPQDLGNYVPSCLTTYSRDDCGTVPYPAVLWELNDDSDEDGNREPDLGFTWSQPNTGRIQVMENGRLVDKYVAVFGGGMDPKLPDAVGNWLYMVDIETGRILYKRRLVGSAPSEPAAVDSDQDGVLDRIYIGTTRGKLYKVDLTARVALEGDPTADPSAEAPSPGGPRIEDPRWEPYPIFDTGGRPIYYPPSVIFVASLSRFALAFGTGDREDLWSIWPMEEPHLAGRFYMILDDDFAAGGPVRTESSYHGVTLGASQGGDYLLDPSTGTGSEHGWYLILGAHERVVTRAFSVAGVTVFSTYVPVEDSGASCAKAGGSNVYTVLTTSANAVGQGARSGSAEGLVSDPFIETSSTSRAGAPAGGMPTGPGGDDLTEELRQVMETLKGLFPPGCKFANVTINIKAVRSDTGVEFIAPVPVCVMETNWQEL